MGFKNIEKKSFSYMLLKTWAQWWHNRVFYKKVVRINTENIPSSGHFIFTPNHQNALMDALGPLFTIHQQLVFLARADIFKKEFLARILYFLKILPVFRIRDGYESLKKNDLIFQKTIDVINAGNGLVILPEGTHAGYHKLRILKKGFARIAFKTEEENDFSMNLQIVPIGIYYSDYESFRSILIVIFGKPITVSEYFELYKDNPAIAISKLKDDLHDRLKSLMINIESEQYYFLYNKIRQYRASQLKKQTEIQQFRAQQEIISSLETIEKKNPEKIVYLNHLVHDFEKDLQNTKLDFETIEKGNPNLSDIVLGVITLIIALPVFIYGYLNNFLPWQITISQASKAKDPQFRSSIKFVYSSFLFPLFYLIQTATFYFIFPGIWLTLAYFLSLPLTAGISWNYFNYSKKIKKRRKLYLLKSSKPNIYNRLNDIYTKISFEIKTILSIE